MNYHDYIKRYEDALYDYYRVKLLVDHLVGGVPKDPDMMRSWIGATCKQFSEEERAKIVKADIAALPKVLEEEMDVSGTTFLVDDGEPSADRLLFSSRPQPFDMPGLLFSAHLEPNDWPIRSVPVRPRPTDMPALHGPCHATTPPIASRADPGDDYTKLTLGGKTIAFMAGY